MNRLREALPLGILLLLLAGCAREDVPVTEAGRSSEARTPATATADSEGFIPLTLLDFQPFPAEAVSWTEIDGVLATTGKPKGYIFSKTPHANFLWRGEFRFVSPDGGDSAAADQSNTGFMLCIQEPHKVWPRSLEVQGKHVEMAQIKSNGGVPAMEIEDDAAARESARRPVGEWNAIEIHIQDGAVTATLNGTVVCRSRPGELTSGLIGLQSENFEVEFRNLRIRDE